MIEINNLTTVSIDKKFLRKIAKEVFRGEKVKKEVGLSIAFVGSSRIKEINKRYRRKNKVTDVLAFGEKYEVGSMKKGKRVKFPDPFIELGEIVICPQQVKQNAKRYRTNFQKELTLVLIHGILHLLGYSYEKGERKAKRMEMKKKYYLSKII